MIVARAGSGWQTVMADLCLILFMVTASALSQQPAVVPAKAAAPAPSPRAEPLAVYRDDAGAPALAEWLAAQPPDPRQQLTLVAQYRPGGEGAALARAGELLAQAGAFAAGARVVIEPGEGGVAAMLAYDDPALARTLQSPEANPTAPGR